MEEYPFELFLKEANGNSNLYIINLLDELIE